MRSRGQSDHCGSRPLTRTTSPTESCLWASTGARLLETEVLALENGDTMVIHAMPAPKEYLDLLP
jgi:hypothetical protein